MQRSVPFFNYTALFNQDEAGLTAVVLDVLRRGAYILQKDLLEFESALARYVGAKHAIGVADGTNAMLLGFQALAFPPASEIVMASHTYVATAAAAHGAGLIPVLADCGEDHLIDPQSVEASITSRTRAIMPTQLNGRTADMETLFVIAHKHGLAVVEDAAQALGSKFKGRCAGTFGAFGTTSFYPAKVLGCFGDGGAVFTDDDGIANRIRLLRDHGRNDDGTFVCWGTNCRLDNLQAAVLLHRLQSFDQAIARRRQIAAMYQMRLRDVKELALPPEPGIGTPHFDIYQNYEIEADQRDRMREYLKERGIGTIIQWSCQPLHKIEALGLDYHLPRTDRLFQRCLLLPMHTALSDADVEYVCANIRSFYGMGD